jgi:hypothetical protein
MSSHVHGELRHPHQGIRGAVRSDLLPVSIGPRNTLGYSYIRHFLPCGICHRRRFTAEPKLAVVAEPVLISLRYVIAARSNITTQKRPAAVYPVASVRLAQSTMVLIYRPLCHLACEWLDGPLS